MKVYRSETRLLVRRFRFHQISFPTCTSYLDAALARFIPRFMPGEIDELRAVMLANNEAVMKDAERRRMDNPIEE